MFSKADQGTGGKSTEPPRLSGAAGVPSILSSDLTITGDLIGAGDIQIDGTVIGDIKGRTLTLSQTAKVEGSLSATEVRLNGSFKGRISADNITLGKGAKVSGEIAQNSMTIELGADFEGSVRRLGAGKADVAGDSAAAPAGARRAAQEDAMADSAPATS